MIPSRSAGGFGFLTKTAVPLSALFGAERAIDVGSSVRILRGNDLLAGAAYMQYCSRLDTSKCHSKSTPS